MSAMIIIYVETGLVEVKKIRGGAINSKVLAMDLWIMCSNDTYIYFCCLL